MWRRREHWFWAWTILGTVHKNREKDPMAQCEVWENLILLHAFTADEALRKAEKIGRSEAGDSRGALRLDGKPAICKFMGVASLGVVHDALEDGAEITWTLKRCKQATASTAQFSSATSGSVETKGRRVRLAWL